MIDKLETVLRKFFSSLVASTIYALAASVNPMYAVIDPSLKPDDGDGK